MKTLRYILLALVLFSTSSIAFPQETEDDVWVVEKNKDIGIYASVNGLKMHGDRFRIIIDENECQEGRQYFTFLSPGGDVLNLKGKDVEIKYNGKITTAKILHSQEVMIGHMALFYLGSKKIDSIIEYHKGSQKISVELIDGKDLKFSDFFLVLDNEWSLTNLESSLTQAQSLCRENNKSSQNTAETKETKRATGTGFFLGSSNYVVTNYHVIHGAKKIQVKLINGEILVAEVALKSPDKDIAILKLNGTPSVKRMNVRLSNFSEIRTGDKIFTYGFPIADFLGDVESKYSEGVINSFRGMKNNRDQFQMSIPIQPGNSGGPIFNEQGKLVGITTYSIDALMTMELYGIVPQNVNFGIKSPMLASLLPEIPEILKFNMGIVPVPSGQFSIRDFKEDIKNNIVFVTASIEKEVGNFQVAVEAFEKGDYKKAIEQLKILCILLTLIFIFKNILFYISNLIMSYVQNNVITNIRIKLFRHISTLSLSFFNNTKISELSSILIRDIGGMRVAFSQSLQKIIVEPISIVSFLTLLFIINIKFSILVIVIIPVSGFFSYKVGQSIRRKSKRTSIQSAGILNIIKETLSNIKIINYYKKVEFIC